MCQIGVDLQFWKEYGGPQIRKSLGKGIEETRVIYTMCSG